jgi:ribosomal protein S18 acetylase RimI-like enzyme
MIRPARAGDFDAIRRFDVFAGDRRSEIEEGRMSVWAAGGEVVGYVTVADYLFHGYPYLQFLCVREGHRRRGVASALVAHVEQAHRGARLFISTESTNAAMLSLIEGRGYCLSGALGGLNRDGSQEVFYFKDIPA